MDKRKELIRHLEQLNEKINTWYERLRPVSTLMLMHQPSPGRWSIMHVLVHLVKTEEVILQYCRKKIQATDLKRTSPLTTLRTSLLPLLVGRRLYRYKAPGVVSPTMDLKSISLEQLFSEWEKVRKEWRQFIEQMPEDKLDKEVYRQPTLGRLGWKGTFVFFENHMKRHWEQIDQLIG